MTSLFDEQITHIMTSLGKETSMSRKQSQQNGAGLYGKHRLNITPNSDRLKPASSRKGIVEVEVAKDAPPGTKTPCTLPLLRQIMGEYKMKNLGQLGNSNVKLIKLGDGYALLTI